MWGSEWPKIQRVAHYLRNRKNIHKYYTPKLMSLGPIHHGAPHLKLGEKYKVTWASMHVQGDRDIAQRLHQLVIQNINDLKDRYTEDAIRAFDDDELSWMLFLDGCALLQILRHPNMLNPYHSKQRLTLWLVFAKTLSCLRTNFPSHSSSS